MLGNYQLADPGNQTHTCLAPKPAPTVTCFHLPRLPRAPSPTSPAQGLPVQAPFSERLLSARARAQVNIRIFLPEMQTLRLREVTGFPMIAQLLPAGVGMQIPDSGFEATALSPSPGCLHLFTSACLVTWHIRELPQPLQLV